MPRSRATSTRGFRARFLTGATVAVHRVMKLLPAFIPFLLAGSASLLACGDLAPVDRHVWTKGRTGALEISACDDTTASLVPDCGNDAGRPVLAGSTVRYGLRGVREPVWVVSDDAKVANENDTTTEPQFDLQTRAAGRVSLQVLARRDFHLVDTFVIDVETAERVTVEVEDADAAALRPNRVHRLGWHAFDANGAELIASSGVTLTLTPPESDPAVLLRAGGPLGCSFGDCHTDEVDVTPRTGAVEIWTAHQGDRWLTVTTRDGTRERILLRVLS